MTERSFIWDTGGGGDASPHSEANTALLFGALVGDRLISANKGVIRGVLNGLAPSSPGAGQVRIASGACIADGHPYINDANVDFTPTTPSIGTTGHRIVARCSWSAQTVRLVDISSADGTATIPAMTQTPGTTYDIPICSFTKSTGGVIASLADNREFAGQPADIFEMRLPDIVNSATGVWKGHCWSPGGGIYSTTTIVSNYDKIGVGLSLYVNAAGTMEHLPYPSVGSTDALKGMAEMRTSGTSGDSIGIRGAWQIDPSTDSFDLACVISLINDASKQIFFGLTGNLTGNDANDRIGFRVNGSGNIIAFCDSGGTETNSNFDTGLAGSASPGTIYALRIKGEAGVITFYVNGSPVFTTSSNVYSGVLAYHGLAIQNGAAAQRSLPYRDYIGRMKAA